MTEPQPSTRPRRWRTALIAVGVVALLGALPVVLSAGRVAFLASGHVHTVQDVPERPVGMVLGAKADPSGPSAFLAARLDVALRLFQEGKIRAVLVTGDGGADANNEPLIMRRYLEARGVPADRIVEDPAGFDTYDSCVRARDVFGVAEMTVITQDYHLGRTIAICREVGVDTVGVGDTSMLGRFPYNWVKGWVREFPANLKMEWDLLTGRRPQADAPDPSLLAAAQS
ncbi:hypothetical protein BJN44_07310 [Tessaracoccus sp. ZS01]|nr:hypothetical protein BJN44_07310 [Tessaracoccus sp. ZS01]